MPDGHDSESASPFVTVEQCRTYLACWHCAIPGKKRTQRSLSLRITDISSQLSMVSSEADAYPPLIACSLQCEYQVFVWRAHRESSAESGSGDSNV